MQTSYLRLDEMKKLLAVLFVMGALTAIWDCLDPFTPDPDLLPVNVIAKSVAVHSHAIHPLYKVCSLPFEIAPQSRRVGHATFEGEESFPPGDKTLAFHLLRI